MHPPSTPAQGTHSYSKESMQGSETSNRALEKLEKDKIEVPPQGVSRPAFRCRPALMGSFKRCLSDIFLFLEEKSTKKVENGQKAHLSPSLMKKQKMFVASYY